MGINEKEMYICSPEDSSDAWNELIKTVPEDFDGYIFYKIRRDSIGKSGGDPTWGDVYKCNKNKISYCGKCVYKKLDYDYPKSAYAEKLWSLIGKRVLKDCRVPDITLIRDSKYKELGMLSHIILDNDTEDLIDMNTLMFYKYERQDLNKFKLIVNFEDLLECIKVQVSDEKNYGEIERQVVETLLLDCVTNNTDRHTNNWCLVRDKNTNKYVLGVFDHSSSFVDMMTEGLKGVSKNGWTSTSIRTTEQSAKLGIGDNGDVLLKYLVKKYPEISKSFLDTLTINLPDFYEDIKEMSGDIDTKRIRRNLESKVEQIRGLILPDERNERGGREIDE